MSAQGPKAFRIVGIGELLWDMLPGGRQLGGAPANFAFHAQSLGTRAAVVSCVGDDPLGREILENLDAMGLDRRHVAVDATRPIHPTGVVTVALDAAGKPTFTIQENAAWDFIPFSPALAQLAARADAICFGSLAQRQETSRETIRAFIDATRPDCLRVFDINLRQSYYSRAVVDDLLKRSDVLKLNDDELPVVADLLSISGGESGIIDRLIERYSLRLVALTKGEKGSLLRSRESRSHRAAERVKVADTVGAGDAFTAAMTLGLLRGRSLDEINDHAARVAAYVCTQPGATPRLPRHLKSWR